jgi:hypothetical protein
MELHGPLDNKIKNKNQSSQARYTITKHNKEQRTARSGNRLHQNTLSNAFTAGKNAPADVLTDSHQTCHMIIHHISAF